MSTKMLPSYKQLFGDLDFKKGDDARTVYSPAAYLTDLLQLLEDNFEDADFDGRRADIKKLLLNAEQTFGEVPYLDIVNRVLENKIGGKVYQKLRSAVYPFNLPFDLQHERVKKHLNYLNVSPDKLNKLFSLNANQETIARESLGMSVAEYDLLIKPSPNALLKKCYKLGPNASLNEKRTAVADFLNTTALSGPGLRELLFQNLTLQKPGGQQPAEFASIKSFFTNSGLNGYARLDNNEERIIWSEGEPGVPDDWFERANRLIRLSKSIGVSISDMDLILRSCCGSKLDKEAILSIAVISNIHKKSELPIDEVCSLFASMNNLGQGNTDEPEDLFNKTFNGRYADISKDIIAFGPGVHESYKGYDMLQCNTQILLSENKEYRMRIQKALRISGKDLALIVEKYSLHTDAFKGKMSLHSLSLLFRLTKLTELLDISFKDLFGLFDVLDKDPAIKLLKNLDILLDPEATFTNCYNIIEGGDTKASLWLVQLLLSLAQWMQQYDFSVVDLQYILSGSLADEKAEETAGTEKLNFLNTLYQQIKQQFFSQTDLQSDLYNARISRIIYNAILQEGSGLVSKADKRILNFNEDECRHTTYMALASQDNITTNDFTGLGIEYAMATKIFDNLVMRGYLNAEGMVLEESFPEVEKDFQIATDFTSIKESFFLIIYDKLVTDNEGNSDEDLELEIYPSNLENLPYSENQRNELYDNLKSNGYIDDDGDVFNPDFFADKKNWEKFEVNSDLVNYSSAVYLQIKKQYEDFDEAELKIKTDDFAKLQLQDFELEDLLENLQFNDYIDVDNKVLDKSAVLKLTAESFNLALVFYPLRHKILAILKQRVQSFKESYLELSPDYFIPTGQDVMAGMVIDRLNEQGYIKEAKITQDKKDFFLDDQNINKLNLGHSFTLEDNKTVFAAIKQIILSIENYKVAPLAFYEIGLEEDDYADILNILKTGGAMDGGGFIPDDKIAYFTNINNALAFNVEGYEDYNKDIFFVLNSLAKKFKECIDDISSRLKNQAEQQEIALFNSLQENLEVDLNNVKVIFDYVLRRPTNKVEEIAVPVLETVGRDDTITAPPKNNKFNSAYHRMKQFAYLVGKLSLTAQESHILFHDQDLVDKYPENLTLPKNLQNFDALLEGMDDKIYLFKDNFYWAYLNENYNLEVEKAPLAQLSEEFKHFPKVDAAFLDNSGTAWIIYGNNYFTKSPDSEKWERKDKIWGKVQSNFDDPEKIDASFVDREGKTFLFAGDQYVRYSQNAQFIDEGYPKEIKGNWPREISGIKLPERYAESIDAAFENSDKKLYFFKDNHFTGSDLKGEEQEINSGWGKIKNNLSDSGKVDAVVHINGVNHIFSGDQVAVYSDHLENVAVKVDDGYPLEIKSHIPTLPITFQDGVDGGFKGFDNKVYLFKDEKCALVTPNLKETTESNITNIWGKIRNNIEKSGSVSAAFVGLDGKTYLFSGDQFYRYSGSDYSKVDEGYPLTISKHWGGLDHVDAAFIMGGKTYLFSQGIEGMTSYVRYSTNDYSAPDEGYPKVPNDNWWNLPFKLVESGFDTPDSVFIGKDGKTYLFNGKQFISFDNIQRWWTEPENLQEEWDSIPFAKVNAAFTGKDGKTYMFAGKRHIRYSDKNYNKIDDRYPKPVNKHWGIITNNIVDKERIDAGLIVNSVETINEDEITSKHTYVFSGTQFFRYTGEQYNFVDEGYPKSISTSLNKEPRFLNLTKSFNHIYSSVADKRNIYLFSDTEMHIVSEVNDKKYPAVIKGGASSAFMNGGGLFIENAEGWFKANGIESRAFNVQPDLPPVLRDVPANFQKGLDSVLIGRDGNTYLFKNKSCYNLLLEKAYPIKEEWGREQNNFYTENNLDAAFYGTDGKLYMFSGDHFVSYTIDKDAGNVIPQFVDENPKPMDNHWGGLTNVDIAFVRDEKTFLLEKADEDGNFRFISYSTTDYSKPDQEMPEDANIDWWEIPSVYLEEGFNRVDAVLFDGDNMFLVKENEFIQYNKAEELWSYPKPLSRIYRGGLLDNDEFGELVTAFNGSDGKTYFFNKNHFASHQNKTFSELKEINTRWGIVRNNIVQNGKIDAAFVFGKTTYLFSGDQYVRYSGESYEFVDAIYPKRIVDSLLKESPFKKISDGTSNTILSIIQDGKTFDAIVADKRSIYFIKGKSCHVVSSSGEATYSTNILGAVQNNILENNKVDAAFVNKKDETILISGDQYFKYTDTDYEFVDSGYPKQIMQNLVKEENLVFASGNLGYTLDAVFIGIDGKHQFFKNKSYFRNQNPDFPRRLIRKAIKGNVGRIRNNFMMNDDEEGIVISAVIVHKSGRTYAFSRDQYIAYSNIENEYVDEGYPKVIKDNWGNLPVAYEATVDGGFVFEGKTYFTKGAEYVRYSDPEYNKIDSIYPQKFTNRWGNWADYLLSDLVTISRFKQLQDDYQGAEATLADFFQSENGPTTNPYQMLADLFDWDVEEVKWLKRKNGFLTDQGHLEVKFNLELVLKIFDIFQLTEKMSSSPTLVFRNVWRKLYSNQVNRNAAANELYKYLGDGNSEKDWSVLKGQIHDEMNMLKRDVLVPFVVNLLSGTKGIQNARDLFEHLLIDVEMGSCMTTSNVKEGVAAVQLYFHRYFVNLEDMEIRGDNDEFVRAELKHSWKWMKNYRVWEANRKVFLYPENYIRPELRDSKTPEFKKLEEALLQGEITQELAAKSYKDYLDGFAIVGNLIISGANIYDQGDERVLVMFGRTRTEPMEYYSRSATFKTSGSIIWDPWYKIDININSTRVFPVYAFGRIMVYWIEINEIEGTDTDIETKGNKTNIDNSRKKFDYRASVKYSFQNFNNEWVHPQVIKKDIKLEYKIDAAFAENNKLTVFSGKYCLITSKDNPYGDTKLIKEAFPGLNTNFQAGVDAVAPYYGKKYFFKENLVVVNSGTTYNSPRYTHHIFPYFQGEVEAAFEVDNLLCLINRSGRYMFYQPKSGGGFTVLTTKVIHHLFPFLAIFFRIPILIAGQDVPKFGYMPPVDAVFKDENEMLYMVRNGQFECYIGREFKEVDGFPQPVKGNLSFNMDKFFNKLHVMEFTEKGQDFTQITYTTPKDSILLYGKLADDFKFYEGSVKTDYSIYLIMAWESFRRSSLTLRYSWKTQQATTIKNKGDTVFNGITALQAKAVKVKALPEETEDEQAEKTKQLDALKVGIKTKSATYRQSLSNIPDQLKTMGEEYDEYFKFATSINNLLKVYVTNFNVTNNLTATLNAANKFRSYKFNNKVTVINNNLNAAAAGNNLDSMLANLTKVNQAIRKNVANVKNMGLKEVLVNMEPEAKNMVKDLDNLVKSITTEVNNKREVKFGSFDIFPIDFSIENNSNFSFGKIGLTDWYCFESRGGTFLCKPVKDSGPTNYEIIRLTTTTIPKLSRTLFSGGIDSLLSLTTQLIDEAPEFGTNKGISYNNQKINVIPVSKNLDYTGANNNYYWEIFFHAPFLISQSLNTGQKFDEAKDWYEYIYDPTDGKGHWKFLPFTKKPEESDLKSEIDIYLQDPFDPHAIARIRQFAYRKSIVMSYIDNLLDYGDMLFGQYTRETINEARMLYVLAYDLLGKKPEGMGVKLLTADTNYNGLKNTSFDYEFLLAKENANGEVIPAETLEGEGGINKSVISPYFFIPTNELFIDYWGRVEDRLYKIRQCLNIMGIKQPLPLFEPPIDPMALVQAASSGGGFDQIAAGGTVTVPHYRFKFMIGKAKELAQKLSMFGNDLLNTLEKKDAEELSILQNKQEHVILSMTRYIKESQVAEAEENIKSLKETHNNARMRLDHYKQLIATGLLPTEIAQISLMAGAIVAHIAATVLNTISGIGHIIPKAHIGLFSFGVDTPDLGETSQSFGEAVSSVAEGLSIAGEVLGMVAQHQRMVEDWDLQEKMAKSDLIQIEAQIAGAEIQKKIAQHEVMILEKEIEQNESIQNFMMDKFTNQQLYQWMASKLSGMYYQTYRLAFDMAKYAERSFQFERAAKQGDVNFINGMYWDSQKKGLLSGESLELDLDRMEQAFIETDSRRFEITKNCSLLELDPVALLTLVNTGVCEFSLSEALYDYDFQGHYSRQIKTISLTFEGEGEYSPFATLTQLTEKTVMEDDVKAVKYLLDPKESAPTSIRSGWRANQQIALSHVDEYAKNNGLFELRFDDDRYLPFEGTGAVSTWRLEMNGKKGSYNIKSLKNIIVNIQYTAMQGGNAFANAVKGLLKPYQASIMFNIAEEFGNEWSDFKAGDSKELILNFTRDMFPNMGSSKIAFIYTKFGLTNPKSKVSMILNDDDDWTLKDNRFTDTSGLSIAGNGTEFAFAFNGKKEDVENLAIVMAYKAVVS